MDIGIIKEENGGRVIITPHTAKLLIEDGNNVYFAKGCGFLAGFLDSDYLASGAKMCDDNFDVIESSNLLVMFTLIDNETLKKIKNKLILSSTKALINNEKIKILSAGKNTLIDFEMLKDLEYSTNSDYIIRQKIDEIEASVAYNIVNYKYNFMNELIGGKLINNFNFNKKTSISIIGCNNLSVELYKKYRDKNVNMYIYDDLNNINRLNFPDDAFIIPLSEIENISRSDIIFITLMDFYKGYNDIISSELFSKLKNPSVVFNFSSGYFKIDGVDDLNSVDYVFRKIENSYYCSVNDVTKFNARDVSPVISNYLFSYILRLSKLNNWFDSKVFKMATIIARGKINNKIKFEKDGFVKNEKILNPFELMSGNSIGQSRWDDLNDRLNNYSDYDI